MSDLSALWRPQGTFIGIRSRTNDGAGSLGSHGRSGDSGGHGVAAICGSGDSDPGFPWAMAGSPNPPKKCVLGKSNTSGERLGGAGTLGHS